ncbi:unnamed protein product [Absidia cylindrospora]
MVLVHSSVLPTVVHSPLDGAATVVRRSAGARSDDPGFKKRQSSYDHIPGPSPNGYEKRQSASSQPNDDGDDDTGLPSGLQMGSARFNKRQAFGNPSNQVAPDSTDVVCDAPDRANH